MNDNTISRRRAIGTGTLFLGAGLIGAVGTTNAATAAEPSPTPVVGTVADMTALIADSKRAVEEYNRGDEAAVAALRALRATLSDEQLALFNAYDGAAFRWYMQAEELLVAELCRHLPGLAPAIRVIADHAYSEASTYGECCMPEESQS